MKLILSSALACFLSLMGVGAHATPQLVNTGTGVYVDFQDGRKAAITHALGKIFRSHLGLRQIENTCDSGQALANCKIHFEMASRSHYLRWAAHPDPLKVGAIVKVKNTQDTSGGQSNNVTDYAGPYYWTNSIGHLKWGNIFRADEIECDQYDWTKQLPVTHGNLLIQSWGGEVMSYNPETGANENLTFGGGFNIELKKTATNTLVITKFGNLRNTGNPFYFSDRVTAMTFLTANNQQCQVAFEVNIQDFVRNLQDPHFNEPDPKTEIPITQTSDFIRFGYVASTVKQLLLGKVPMEAE